MSGTPVPIKIFGYRWILDTGQKKIFGYRWVPGTGQKKIFGYRWVPGTSQKKKFGYRWVLGNDKIFNDADPCFKIYQKRFRASSV